MSKTKQCTRCKETKEHNLFWRTGYGGNRRKICAVCATKHQQQYVKLREKKYIDTEKWPFPNGWWIFEYQRCFDRYYKIEQIVLNPIKINGRKIT